MIAGESVAGIVSVAPATRSDYLVQEADGFTAKTSELR